MKNIVLDRNLLPEIPVIGKRGMIKKNTPIGAFNSTQDIKGFKNPLKKSHKRNIGHRVTSSKYSIKDDKFYQSNPIETGFAALRNTSNHDNLREDMNPNPFPHFQRIGRRYTSKHGRILKEKEGISYKKRISSRKSGDNPQNMSETNHLFARRCSNYQESSQVNQLAKSPLSITPKDQSKFHIVDLNKIRIDIKALQNYKTPSNNQRSGYGNLPGMTPDRTNLIENSISKEKENLKNNFNIKEAKTCLNMTAEKFAKPSLERNQGDLTSLDDINISGEKCKIKRKYDIEAVDFDKIDMDSIAKNEPIEITTIEESQSRFKFVQMSPTAKSKSRMASDIRSKDSKYRGSFILKQYKIIIIINN